MAAPRSKAAGAPSAASTPSAAAAQPGKPAAKVAATLPPPSGTLPATASPAAVPSSPRDPATAAVLKGLRAALAESARAGEQPDLAEALLSSLAEATWVGLVHGHYGLAGSGHALRAGALPAADAQTIAADTAQNFQRVAAMYAGLAGRKQFDLTLAGVFRDLSALSSLGDHAARSLGAWAKEKADAAKADAAKADAAKADAFETALEAYRVRLQEVARALRGPQ
ncbi:MAG: hypothetical protein EXR79_11845 [Myxococcales bacterium]|nr:hypothetical protein [Myxococcales bacterium]